MVWLDGGDLDGLAARYSYVASDPVETETTTLASPEPLAALRALGREGRRRGCLADTPMESGSSPSTPTGTWPAPTRTRAAARRHARDPEQPAVWFGKYDARGGVRPDGEDGVDRGRLTRRLQRG